VRRAVLGTLLAALVLGASASAEAASWAQPQIRVVVHEGVMGPSVAAFRPRDPLTAGALARAMTALTGAEREPPRPDRIVRMRELERALVRAAGLRGAARRIQAELHAVGVEPPKRLGAEVVARGKYTSTAKTITFDREQGSGCTGAGTYTWKKSGKTMTFARKRETSSCQARALVLGHRFTQVR